MLALCLSLSTINIAYGESQLNVDRIWQENDFSYAMVTYTNKTKSTFNNAVTIKCIATDHAGNKINYNTRSFFAHEYGPIKPGFQGTLKVPIKLNGIHMQSINCNVNAW